MIKNYFEAKVKYTGLDQSTGKEKKMAEVFLIPADTFGEAEDKTKAEMDKLTSQLYHITGISRSKITEFINDDGDQFIKAITESEVIDEKTGKTKKTSNTILLLSESIETATDKVNELIEGFLNQTIITGVNASAITDVLE